MIPRIRLTLFVFIAGAITAFLVLLLYNDVNKDQNMPLVHKLKFPLILSGPTLDDHDYLLPKGTSLYYDQAFPEGFVRFKVYVNVEGVKLESKETTDEFWLEPLTAYPVDAENMRKLLRNYPLSKEELAEILRASTLTKDEIKNILSEYL